MLLTFGFFVAALLYASVGHGGASGYLAIMALAGMAPAEMKPVALVLNVVVSGIGVVSYGRAGQHSWRTTLPFVAGAAPLAFVGGGLPVPPAAFKLLVGIILGLAALRLLFPPRATDTPPRPPPVLAGLLIGAGLGLLAGLTGTGGGIFLTPILLFAGWADARRASAASSVFILVNSVSGLLGGGAPSAIPASFAGWAGAVAAGGLLGAWLGSRRMAPIALRRALALVLAIASGKLILS
jgi:uncharacterized membrane protein YfcA